MLLTVPSERQGILERLSQVSGSMGRRIFETHSVSMGRMLDVGLSVSRLNQVHCDGGDNF